MDVFFFPTCYVLLISFYLTNPPKKTQAYEADTVPVQTEALYIIPLRQDKHGIGTDLAIACKNM